MSTEHEAGFIDAFVRKDYRERYRMLLSEPKRRQRLTQRFPWGVHVDERFATPVPRPWLPRDVCRRLRELGALETVYVISAQRATDATFRSLDEAIEEEAFGPGAIVSCLPGELAWIVGEDGDKQFILHRRGRESREAHET